MTYICNRRKLKTENCKLYLQSVQRMRAVTWTVRFVVYFYFKVKLRLQKEITSQNKLNLAIYANFATQLEEKHSHKTKLR